MDRLELDQNGVTLEQLTEEALLLDESGVALDSVDALDMLVATQQMFGFKIPQINRDFIQKHCASIGTLADYIVGRVTAVAIEA